MPDTTGPGPFQKVPPVLEIRVHGVSNTPPEELLLQSGPADIDRVAGDAVTGLYRAKRWDPDARVETQAYSWGALTSGLAAKKDLARALWMLVLPFALVNVGFWSRLTYQDPRTTKLGGLTSYLARLLALSLTATLLLAATGVGADLVGWQWAGQYAGDPAPEPAWLSLLTHGWLSSGTRPLAVGLAAPLLVLAVVALISLPTFRYEAVSPSTAAAGEPGADIQDAPLSAAWFWRGDGQVRALAAGHRRVAVAVPLLATVLPVTTVDADRSSGLRWAGWLLSAGLVSMLVASLVQLARREVTRRGSVAAAFDPPEPGRQGTLTRWVGPGSTAAKALLVVVAALCLLYLVWPRADVPRSGPLPGLNEAIRALFAGQALAVLALAMSLRWTQSWARAGCTTCAVVGLLAVLAVASHWDRQQPALAASLIGSALTVLAVLALLVPATGPVVDSDGSPHGSTRPVDRAAWRGAGGAVFAAAAVLLGALYSAGVLFFVSRWLSRGGPTIAAAPSLRWAAAGLTPFAAVALGVAGGRWMWVRHRGKALEATVRADYQASQPHAQRRAVDVARARAFHELMEEHALTMVGWVAVVALAGVVALIALSTGYESVESTGWVDWAALALVASADLGTWLALALMAGLVALAGIVYRAGPLRRSISVVWDLATFWPRACHPFAPPGYAERCVPQLVTRICGDDERRGFILAGHSQGSLVCLATVLQLPEARRAQVGLLTFGTQLNRLYGRAFAAFVGPATLHRTASLLQDAGTLRWRSFFRLTDPLGYPVDVGVGEQGADRLIVDHPGRGTGTPLRDPTALSPPPDEIRDPAIRGHSDYLPEPAYTLARDELADVLTRPS